MMIKKRGFEKVTGFEDDAVLPKRATAKSAGYDFATTEEVTVKPGETVLVKTGIKAYMQDDEVLKLYVRSSLGFKKHLMLANSVGIIDADYYNNSDNEGHIMVALHNYGKEYQVIKKGERIAQGIFTQYQVADNDDTNTLRAGGFGSTSK